MMPCFSSVTSVFSVVNCFFQDQSNALFPVMDQNLPEGYLFQRIRESYPKQPLTAMHLLALAGENGIGPEKSRRWRDGGIVPDNRKYP